MTRPREQLLPYPVRVKVWNLIDKEKTTHEIADAVLKEAKPFVKSKEQLIRCIASIRGKYARRLTPVDTIRYEPPLEPVEIPTPKKFPEKKYREIIRKLRKNMPGQFIEKSSEKIAMDILKNHEGFETIKKGPQYVGTPFDFFAFRDGNPYIIEMKSSLSSFNVPGETQKRRMKQLLAQMPGLKVAVLQIALKKGQYRILYDAQVKGLLFPEKGAPMQPIREWIRERVKK